MKIIIVVNYLLSECVDLLLRILGMNAAPCSHSTHQSNKIFGNSHLAEKESRCLQDFWLNLMKMHDLLLVKVKSASDQWPIELELILVSVA